MLTDNFTEYRLSLDISGGLKAVGKNFVKK